MIARARSIALGCAMLAALACHAGHAQTPACADIAARWEADKATLAPPQVGTLLLAASDNGCANVVETLLAGGALLEAKDRFGNAPLAHAARENRLEVMKLLLARGADVAHQNVGGSSALFLAIERHHPQAAELLIEHGADANLPGRSGSTPLAAAAFAGEAQIVETLLAHHADPNIADRTGKAPIVYAAARGRPDIVKLLLAGGVPVNARYGNDLTALMWAAGHADGVAEPDGIATVTLLLAAGAHVDDADNRGRTALMIAAERGHAAIAKLLLAHGANAGLRDKAGKSARDLAGDDAVRAVLAM